MIKDIYVYFTDKEYMDDFRNLSDFVWPTDYDIVEYSKSLQEEYGKLKLKNINIRLLFDSGRETKCPWCNHPNPEIIEETSLKEEAVEIYRFYARCPNCLARGPALNVNRVIQNDEAIEYKQMILQRTSEYKALVLQRWQMRVPKTLG